MAYHWLQINRPCILELKQLKDYGGQPLIFKGGLQKRCVTEEVFQHPMVQGYLSQQLLVEVDQDGKPATGAAVVAPSIPAPMPAPAPAPAPAPVAPEPTPVAPPPTPAVEVEIPAVPVSDVPVSEPSTETVTEVTAPVETQSEDDNKGFEIKRRRR
jgi:hypothetical protein